MPGGCPVAQAEPRPQGEFGDTRRSCPRPTPSPALLGLLRAPVFRSPVETSSVPLARDTGRGSRAPNKEQRLNVLPVCALSLSPSPGAPAPALLASGPSAELRLAGSPALVTLGDGAAAAPAHGEGAVGPPGTRLQRSALPIGGTKPPLPLPRPVGTLVGLPGADPRSVSLSPLCRLLPGARLWGPVAHVRSDNLLRRLRGGSGASCWGLAVAPHSEPSNAPIVWGWGPWGSRGGGTGPPACHTPLTSPQVLQLGSGDPSLGGFGCGGSGCSPHFPGGVWMSGLSLSIPPARPPNPG